MSDFSFKEYMKIFEEKGTEAALDYRAAFVPDYLYKFFWLYDVESCKSDHRLIDENEKRFNTLQNNQLWFALPKEQNDPYECSAIYFDREALKEYGFTSKELEILDDIYMTIPLCSFADNGATNLPMWAHYANNHRGYCVKYKITNKYAVRNISYEPQRIKVFNIIGWVLLLLDEVEKGNTENEKILEEYRAVLMENFFMKHESWKYEKEYRAIYPLGTTVNHGLNVSLDELGISAEEIICGYKCAEEHIKRLSSIADSLSIPCKKCELSETDFTVFREV